VNKSGAIFDPEKLNWMNGSYIRSMPEEEYVKKVHDELVRAGYGGGDKDRIRLIALAIRSSLSTFHEVPSKAAPFYRENIGEYQSDALEWICKPGSNNIFRALIQELQEMPAMTVEGFKGAIKKVQGSTGTKGKELWLPVRSAITGVAEGPDLPLVIETLGKDKVIHLLERALVLAESKS
jgi:nondiscriminating glutamyl-tRNA synthetase